MHSEKVLQKIYDAINQNIFGGRLPVAEFVVRRKCITKNGWGVQKKSSIYEIYVYDYCLFEDLGGFYTSFLHQIIHILNMEDGIKDTSRGGQYHNKRFKKRAEEWGLLTEWTDARGNDTVGIRKEFFERVSLKNTRRMLNDAIEKDMNIEGEKMPEKKVSFVCPICRRRAVSGITMKLVCGWCMADMDKAD